MYELVSQWLTTIAEVTFAAPPSDHSFFIFGIFRG